MLKRVHVMPNDGAETVGGIVLQAIDRGKRVGVVLELTAVATSDQEYEICFTSGATPFPSCKKLKVESGRRVSLKVLEFDGPTAGLPDDCIVTATHTTTVTDVASVTVVFRS